MRLQERLDKYLNETVRKKIRDKFPETIDDYIEELDASNSNYVKLSDNTIVSEFLGLYEIVKYEKTDLSVITLTKKEFQNLKSI